MPEFAVATKYSAIDGLTPAHARMGASADKLGRRIQTSMGRADASVSTFGQTAKGVFLGGAMMYGTMALQQGLASVVNEALQLDSNLTQAGSKFDKPIKRGTAAYRELEDTAKRVGAATQFTAGQAAQGLDFLAMAGFNAQQAMAALPGLAELATAANIDLARASDIAADSLGAFGLMTDAPDQLATNLTRVSDVFAKTANISTVSMETLYETMKQAGPVAKTAGADIETFAAAAGMLGSASIKGGEAGTTLKNIFLKLAGPVSKASALLQKLGVRTQDSNGNLRDMFDILGDLGVATKDMGTATRSAAMDTLFGKYAVAGANVLLDKGRDSLKAYREQLYKAGGSSKTMADEMRKSLIVRLEILKSALMDKGLNIMAALTGGKDPGEALDKITKWVSEIDVAKVLELGKSVAKLAAGFMAFRMVGGVIGTLTTAGPAIAMLATPVGALAAAIGLLTTAAIMFPEKFQPLIDVFKNDIGPVVDSLSGGFQNLKGFVIDTAEGSNGLVGAWTSIAQLGIMEPLKFAASAFESVTGKIRYLAEVISIVLPKLGFVKSFFETSLTVMKAYIWPLEKIIGLWMKLGGVLSGMSSSVINYVTGGALDEASANIAARDQQRASADTRASAMNAIGALPAGEFGGNVGQSVAGAPAPAMARVESSTTVNLQVSGLPAGMTATASTPDRTAPPVNMALAGAR